MHLRALSARPQKSSWTATALILAVALLLSVTIPALNRAPDLGMAADPAEDGTQLVTWVVPTSYAWDAGLRPGDRIRSLPLPEGSSAFAAFEVISRAGVSRTVTVARHWTLPTDVVLILLGLEFLAAGLFVYWRATDRPTASLFLLLSGAASIAFLTSVTTAAIDQVWTICLNWLSVKLAPLAFACFFCMVPVRRWNITLRLLAWALLPLTVWYTYALLVDSSMFDVVAPFSAAYVAAGLLLGVLALLWPFITRAPREHRRMLPVAVSGGVAVFFFLGGSLVPSLFFAHYPIRPETAILALALLPLGFVWAMLSYRLMGMDIGSWATLRTVFDTSIDPIFVVDRDGFLLNASRSGLELLGIEKVREARIPFEKMIARGESSVAADEAAKEPVVRRVLAGEVVRDEEECLRLPNGTTVYMSVGGTPVRDERGAVDLAVLIYRNISARVEAQHLREEHLTLLAHDLRSPLTVLKTQASLLLRSPEVAASPALLSGIGRLNSSAAQLNSLLGDLLEAIRLEAGLIRMRPAPLILSEFLGAIANRLSVGLDAERIQLSIPADLPTVYADEARLDRALTNVVSNALRYTPQESPVELKAFQEGGAVHVEVIDHGPGIDPDDLPHIFERRYRGSSSSGKEGTGLGLYIARMIVTLHGGRIWAESRPGQGATFHITLPLK